MLYFSTDSQNVCSSQFSLLSMNIAVDGKEMQSLAATAMYGYYAKLYFA